MLASIRRAADSQRTTVEQTLMGIFEFFVGPAAMKPAAAISFASW
jgi:hypothetical protein